jgi:hypothetical protein
LIKSPYNVGINNTVVDQGSDSKTILCIFVLQLKKLLNMIMLSVNFFCNISSYDMLAYIAKNYIALIYYAKIVHLLCQFHAGKVGFSAVCQAMHS